MDLDLERAIAASRLFDWLAPPLSMDDALCGCSLMDVVKVGARVGQDQGGAWSCQ